MSTNAKPDAFPAKKMKPIRTKVLVLQHPQEPHEVRGTVALLERLLPGCRIRVGLSWRNLSQAWGSEMQSKRWAVLYLGSGVKGGGKEAKAKEDLPVVQFVSKKGQAISPPEDLEGIVVLDGTWSQAKTLWWRNAWLLKLWRMVLTPREPSLYGRIRHEPRRECLSTLEATALTLVELGEDPQLKEVWFQEFKNFLK